MIRSRTTLLVAAITPFLVLAAPVPESVSHAKRFESTFGASYSPNEKCSLQFDGTALTAKFPKGWTGSEYEHFDGPYTERTARGDFVLTVTMRTTAPAIPPKTRGAKRCGLGGGLAVWEPDAKNPGKAAVDETQREKSVTVCRYYTEIGSGEWTRGDFADYPGTVYDRHNVDAVDPSETVHLRITRKGNTLTTAYSSDGEKWTETMSRKVKLPDSVSVGVWAFEGTNLGCDVIFEKFTLEPLK